MNIQPISIWKDGEAKTASILQAVIINDDLATNATFYWQLYASQEVDGEVVQGERLQDGNLNMAAEEYQAWDDTNAAAYQWIASKLNLTIA